MHQQSLACQYRNKLCIFHLHLFSYLYQRTKIYHVTHLSSCRFMCCLLVAVPLAATLLTAIIRWKRNKEVSPEAESSCLNSSRNRYGTLKNNGSSMSEMNTDTLEENDDGKYDGLFHENYDDA